MDVLLLYLREFGFERLCSDITPPIVVHSVPGGGKSSLIREVINKDRRFTAYTFGKEDPDSLTGIGIKRVPAVLERVEFALIDEYIEGYVPDWAFAVFADPLQGGGGEVRAAHFIKRHSHRFGRCTAQLLRELRFDITADLEDVVQVRGLYEVDPRDTIVYHEAAIGALLKSHSVEAYCISEIRGQTFESVTYVTAAGGPVDREKAFQCLTRHRKSLLILCPDASYTAV